MISQVSRSLDKLRAPATPRTRDACVAAVVRTPALGVASSGGKSEEVDGGRLVRAPPLLSPADQWRKPKTLNAALTRPRDAVEPGNAKHGKQRSLALG